MSMIDEGDKLLYCRDCGQDFIFTAREQAFYTQKGFSHEPVRCAECRLDRKNNRGNGNAASYAPNDNNPGYNNRRPTDQAQGNRPAASNYNNRGYNNGGYNNGNEANGNTGFRPRNNDRERTYDRPRNNYNAGNGGGNNWGNNNRPAQNNGGMRPNYTGGYNSRPNNSYNNNSYNNMNGGERKTYPITCASCGVKTEVNFVPRPGSPVYCRTCYNNNKYGN